MPELPEVKTVVKDLNSEIKNLKIVDVKVNLEKMIKDVSISEFKNFLKNETIKEVENYGKHIIFKLTNNKNLLSHLRMTGKYFTSNKNRNNLKHDHVIFKLDKKVLYYNDSRKFGTFHIKKDSDLLNTNPLNKVGKEPDKIDAKVLFKQTKNKTIPVKTFLLDQSYIAGLGNIYACEALYFAKIDPFRKVNSLKISELEEILKYSSKVMNKATELGGSSVDSYARLNGVSGGYQTHLKVYGKAGESCEVCKTKIKKEIINQRMTYFCPTCQK